jgi:hypothetical protein
MQSNFPIRGYLHVWFTWREELYLSTYLLFIYEVTAKITPDVPPVTATSPGSRTFKEKALLGWSPLR